MASSLNIGRIHAAYGAVRVIEDVSLTIGAGETVVLLGTNGNGKATLMKCSMGMVRPSEGSIVAEIDGVHHDPVGRTTEEIVDPASRSCLPAAVLLTVEENLRLAPSAAPRAARSTQPRSVSRPSAPPSGARSLPAR